MRSLVIAAALLVALVAAPLGELSVASDAAAYACPITGDVREDVRCRTSCTGFDPKTLKFRPCPD